MKRLIFAFLLIVAASACSRNESATKAIPPNAESATATSSSDPNRVVIEVNGTKLSYAQADEEISFRIAALKGRIPPDRVPEFRKRTFDNVVDQFIMRTLLLAEADRLNITITPQDEEEAIESIRANLPEGLSIEDVMKNSPLGEKRMRDEMLIGIRINKLLETKWGDGAKVDDEAIDAFIEKHRERLSTPETVQASHILLSFDEDDDESAKTAKRIKIEKLREQLLAGADFEQLAKDNSSCPSAARGGDLGTIQRGKTVPAFELAAFSQEAGDIGPIVETQFGYHIIKVTAKTPAGLMDRDKIAQLVKNRDQQTLMTDLLAELRKKAKITDYRQIP